MTSSHTLRLLHVGDLHFWRIPLNPLAYANKRLLGVGNLLVGGRAKRFRQDQLPKLSHRLREVGGDLMLISGDFSSTALPAEFRAARALLEPLAPLFTQGIRAVPGNHDCYLGSPNEAETFASTLGPALGPVKFFHEELLGAGVLLLAVNATTSNGMGSHGRLTERHLSAIGESLARHSEATRILFLCHFPQEHPPRLLPHDRGPQLLGGEKLLPVFVSDGRPTLWLHGHHHYRWIFRSPTAANLLYLNAGAPALARKGPQPDLGFHEVQLGEDLKVRTHWFEPGTSRWHAREAGIPHEPGGHEDLKR